MPRFTIIETPVVGDTESMLIYTRWAIRDAINQGDVAPLPALGAATGFEVASDKAVFYADNGWSLAMLEALERYLAKGLPVERRYIAPEPDEIDDPEVRRAMRDAAQQQRQAEDDKVAAVFAKVGAPNPWA